MTIQEVAKLAGVSPGTVSNVLNHTGKVAPETEKRVWAVVKKYNYVPNRIARELKTSHSNNIFVISEDIRAFPSPGIIDGICEYCHDTEYTITLFNLRIEPKIEHYKYNEYTQGSEFKEDLRTAVTQAQSANAAGIIYCGIYPRDIENIFPNLDIPVTYCYSYSHGNNYCVNCNDFQGGKLAADYLIAMGHRKIGLICGVADTMPTQKRLMGYKAALAEHNLPFVPQYVAAGEDWQYEYGYAACRKLLELNDPPTAILAMSDIMAAGAIHAAQETGRKVPDDLSVHGYDNIEYLSAFYLPSLTTVAMPLQEIGRESAKLEIQLIKNQIPTANNILVDCSHIERHSVKRYIV